MDHQGHHQHSRQDGRHQDALKIPGHNGRRLARWLCRTQARDTVAGPPQCRTTELQRKGGAQSPAQPHIRPPAQSPIPVCTLWVEVKGASGLAGSCCFAFINLGVLGGEQSCLMPADQTSNICKQPHCCSGPLSSGRGRPSLQAAQTGCWGPCSGPISSGEGSRGSEQERWRYGLFFPRQKGL